MQRALVIDAEELAPRPRAWLEARADVITVGPSEPRRFQEVLGRADAIVVRTYTRVDRALLDAAPRLKVVGRAGVGCDNVDVAACRERGIEVVYTPEANSGAVCELVFALLFDVLRPRRRLTTALTAEEWSRARAENVGDRELADLTLSIWGLGRVGRRMARAGRAFGMRVLYNDLRVIPESEREGAAPADVDGLVRDADVLTLHVDGRPANRGLVDGTILAKLKPNAILVNAARGFVVDVSALARHLRANPGSWAVCDVHEPEPIPPDYPLLALPNAVLVPHLGAATRPSKERMSQVVEDVWRVLTGAPPRWPAPA